MTKKQFACIETAKDVMARIRDVAIYGQDACENYDSVYYKLCEIEEMACSWLGDFCDTDPNYKYNKGE